MTPIGTRTFSMRRPLRPRPAADDFADGVAERGHRAQAFGHLGDALIVQAQPVHHRRGHRGGLGGGGRLPRSLSSRRLRKQRAYPPLSNNAASFTAVEATASEAAASRAREVNPVTYCPESAIAAPPGYPISKHGNRFRFHANSAAAPNQEMDSPLALLSLPRFAGSAGGIPR